MQSRLMAHILEYDSFFHVEIWNYFLQCNFFYSPNILIGVKTYFTRTQPTYLFWSTVIFLSPAIFSLITHITYWNFLLSNYSWHCSTAKLMWWHHIFVYNCKKIFFKFFNLKNFFGEPPGSGSKMSTPIRVLDLRPESKLSQIFWLS